MRNILIRQAEKSDAAKLIEYLKKVTSETYFLRLYPEEVTFSIQEEESFIQSMADQENSTLLVAYDGSQIVSIAGIHGQQFKKFKHCAEFGLSVLKSYWNKGIGKEMTINLIEWSKDNPILKKIILHVNIENPIAINLYKKMGFIEEGRLKNDFYYDERYIDTLIMAMQV